MPVFNISNHQDRMQCNNLCNSTNSEGDKAFDMHSLGTNLFPFSKTLTASQGFSLAPGVSASSVTSPMVSVEQCYRTSSSIRKMSPARHLSTPIKRRRQPISCDSESDSGGSDSDQSSSGSGTDRSYLIASALFKRRLHATGEGSTSERSESRQPLRCSEPDFRVYAVLHSALRLEAERSATANANSERVPLHLSSQPGADSIGHQRRNSSDLLHAQSPAKLARLRATPLSSSWSDLARAAAGTPSQLVAREQMGTACGGVALIALPQSSIAATPAFCASSPPPAAGQAELPMPSDSSVFCSAAPSFEMGEPDADLWAESASCDSLVS